MTKRSAWSHAANASRRAAALLVVATIAACAGSDTSANVAVEPDPAATTPTIDETLPPPTDATTTAPTATTASGKPAPTPTRCATADVSDNTSGEQTTLAIWHAFDGDVVAFLT